MRSIFISSTFSDMQAERDLLTYRVLPSIREFAKRYGEAITFIDLRWGIDTAHLETEEGARKVLSVCLDEIDRAKPYMVILLGERYGMIPSERLIRDAAKQKEDEQFNINDLDSMEKSITSLEIEYGALSKKGQLDRCLFYYREPLPIEQMSEVHRKQYLAESTEHAEKLAKLKLRINSLTGNKARSYPSTWDSKECRVTGLEKFEDMVTQDLKIMLSLDFGIEKKLSQQQKEEQEAWLFYKEKAANCTARVELFRDYAAEIIKTDTQLFVLQGCSGSGKSTAISSIATHLHNHGCNVFPFICGHSRYSSKGEDIIKQAVYYMETILDRSEHFEDTMVKEQGDGIIGDALKEWKDAWTNLNYEYSRSKKPPLVFAIDALDQLYMSDVSKGFQWLPEYIPANMSIVVTCLDTFSIPGHLRVTTNMAKITLDLMNEKEKELVLQGLEENSHKQLSYDIKRKLLKLPLAANPLYQSMMYQRFQALSSDDFKAISELGSGIKAINDYMLKLIEGAPKDLSGMCAMMLKEAAKHINEQQSNHILLLLAASRNGLRESDIRAIFDKENYPYNSLDSSRLLRCIRPYVGEHSDGRIDFLHESIRHGLRQSMSKRVVARLNQAIYELLESLPDNDPVHVADYIYFAYICNKKAEMINRIAGYNHDNARWAGSELHTICISDKGLWLGELLESTRSHEAFGSFIDFVNADFYRSFSESIPEIYVLQQLMLKVEDYCNQLEIRGADFTNRKRLCVSYERIADIFFKSNRTDEALGYYQKSQDTRVKLLLEHSSPDNKKMLSDVYERMADIRREKGQLTEAIELYNKSLFLREQVAAQHNDVIVRVAVVDSYARIADVFRRQGKAAESIRFYQRSLDAIEQLPLERDKPDMRVRLSNIYEEIAGLYKSENSKNAEAFELCKKSLSIKEQLVRELGTYKSREDLSKTYNSMAKLLEDEENIEMALTLYLKSLTINEQLARELGTPSSFKNLQDSYYYVQSAYSILNNDELSMVYMLLAFKIAEQNHLSHPTVNVFRQDYLKIKRELNDFYTLLM